MTKTKKTKAIDITTEEKIKSAARIVFHKKGFAATRTRDIAEEAGVNLALLNYYFRTKEKLFEIIMFETMFGFMQNMTGVLNDEKTTLIQKVELIVSNYIELITQESDMPIFMLTEIRNNAENLLTKIPIKQIITNSVFYKQHKKAVAEKKIAEPNPLHFLMNILGLVIFPFIGKPLLQAIDDLNEKQFNELMQRRKKLIPIWIKAIMKAN